MGKKSNGVDMYIDNAAEYAKPILTHLRQLIHKACPKVEETIKWGCPHFVYPDSILCSMAAFKNHAVFGFRNYQSMEDPDHILETSEKTAMGHLGGLRSIKDLPADRIMLKYIQHAAQLNRDGIKPPVAARNKNAKNDLPIPAVLKQTLAKNKIAAETFRQFNYTNKKEYIDWITEAKTEATRNTRLAKAMEWMREGKTRNWKYIKK